MKTGIIVNFSYNGFDSQATELKASLEALGENAEILTNKQAHMLEDEALDFTRCIFLDKDVPLGLRLEGLGMRLYNNIGSIELCDDKCRFFEIMRRDFKLPKTYPAPLSFAEADCSDFLKLVADELSFPLIAKYAYGSLGREVFMIENKTQLDSFYKKNRAIPHLYQQFIAESSGKDMRIFVIGGKVQAAMIRKNEHDFRANVFLGGTAMSFEPDSNVCSICEAAASALGLDFCGVDLLFSEGEPYICEVNSNAMFAKISSVTGVNLSGILAQHIVDEKINESDYKFLKEVL